MEMVIGPGQGKVSFFVIIGDGEFIPAKFNTPNVVVYRKGWMTFGDLVEIKSYGTLAKPADLAPEVAPACNYSGDGQPLHQHGDGTWWYFDAEFSLENGPYATESLAYESLVAYCKQFQDQKDAGLGLDIEGGLVLFEKLGLTSKTKDAKVVGEVHDETIVEIEGDSDDSSRLD
jgi:hypothetical protein